MADLKSLLNKPQRTGMAGSSDLPTPAVSSTQETGQSPIPIEKGSKFFFISDAPTISGWISDTKRVRFENYRLAVSSAEEAALIREFFVKRRLAKEVSQKEFFAALEKPTQE